MKKFVLLLIALTIAPWARTWEDAKILDYYTQFEDDSLDTFGLVEKTQGIYLYIYGEGNDDSMGVYREYRSLNVRNNSNDADDSIWVSKYWMDDSLRESPVVIDADVDPGDFRLLTFDSLHTEYDLWPLLDERAEKVSDTDRLLSMRKSLFLLYRKDSSYYALCLLGYYPSRCEYYLSCQFQDDGTTNFEKIPDIEGVPIYGCSTSLPQSSRRTPTVGLREGVPYLINGSRSRGGASSVIIRNGQPKLELRK